MRTSSFWIVQTQQYHIEAHHSRAKRVNVPEYFHVVVYTRQNIGQQNEKKVSASDVVIYFCVFRSGHKPWNQQLLGFIFTLRARSSHFRRRFTIRTRSFTMRSRAHAPTPLINKLLWLLYVRRRSPLFSTENNNIYTNMNYCLQFVCFSCSHFHARFLLSTVFTSVSFHVKNFFFLFCSSHFMWPFLCSSTFILFSHIFPFSAFFISSLLFHAQYTRHQVLSLVELCQGIWFILRKKPTKIPFVLDSLILCALFCNVFLFYPSLLREWIETERVHNTKSIYENARASTLHFWWKWKRTWDLPFSPFIVIKVRTNLTNPL